MKTRTLKLSLTAAAALFFVSCATLKGIGSFLTCNYNLQQVTDPRLAGISLTSTADLTNLDLSSAAKVAATLLTGSLPLSVTVNVGVNNPNGTAAQIEGLEWALWFNGTSMIGGETQQRIYVEPNGGTAIVPLTVQIDLAQLFNKEARDDMMSFANGLLHLGQANQQDSKVALKIRPRVSFAGQVFTPGWIGVSAKL